MTIDEWLKAGRPWNVILHGDCMELMQYLKDKSINLACVDPPYGIKRLNNGSGWLERYGNTGEWNNKKPDRNYFNELFRISEYQIIWGANNFEMPPTEYFIIWDKLQFYPNMARGEYAWTNIKKTCNFFECRFGSEKYRIHPTQKPVALYRWLLQNYAKSGDKIIDTHSGSGSCAIACHLEKHDFLAIEKDYDYWKASVKRYNTEISQGKLF